MDVRRRLVLPPIALAALLIAACSTTPERTPLTSDVKPVAQAGTAAKSEATVVAVPAAPTSMPSPLPTSATTPSAKPAISTTSPKPATPPPPPRPQPKPGPVAVAKPAAKPVMAATPAPPPGKPATTPVAKDDRPATTTQPAPIRVSLDNLPLTIGDAWILDRNEANCSLASKPVQLDDGQGGTPVTLQVAPDSLRITTISDIDTTYEKTGITIDKSQHFDLETVERRTNLVFTQQKNRLLNVMQNGQQLTLTLGFWPTWPQTQTYSVDIPLQDFASAMTALNTCNRLLNQP